MDYFIPSEIARLVLGYLKEEQCTKSYNLFVNECIHLREYAALLRHGREYPTTIADMTLKQILNEYGKHKQHESRLKSDMLDGLWLKHDALISQIRARCTPNTPSAVPSSGRPAARAQGQRFSRSRRPNAMGAIEHSRATIVTGGKLEVQNPEHHESFPSSPALTEEAVGDGTVDSDSEGFVLEAGQTATPPCANKRQRDIRTMSPKSLGGILVDISQVEEHCTNLDYPANFVDGRQDNSVTQCEAVPSTSTEAGMSQENTFTNHQRKAAGTSNVQSIKAESMVKPKQVNSKKPQKGKRQVVNSSQEEEVPLTKRDHGVRDQSTLKVTDIQDDSPHPGISNEPTLDCKTPKKTDPRSTAIAIGKSPRRKGPAPKRRSTCRDDLTCVPFLNTTNSNSSTEEVVSMALSMPCLDDLVNNLNLAEKLAQTINVVKQSAESGALNTASAPVQTPSLVQPDTQPTPASPPKNQLRRSARQAKKDKQAAAATISAPTADLTNEENIGSVLHVQDSVVTQEAVKSILEMTKSDPDFDVLFHMFSSDKPIIFDEVDEPDVTQTSITEAYNSAAKPVASTSEFGEVTTAVTANYQASPQLARVLHPGTHGQPDYVETVKVSAIQEVIRTPTTTQPESSVASQDEAGCFKIPDPPATGKSKETSPNVEESLASLKGKSGKGGNRKKPAKKLSVPRKKRSNSTDSSDSTSSESGPTSVPHSPVPTCVVSASSPVEVAPSPGPVYTVPSHTVPSPLLLTSQVNQIMSRATGIPTPAPVNQVDNMSPELTHDVPVISNPGELNMSQYAVVDLGHIQTPATISLVTSDGTETAVASTVMPNFNIMAELANCTPVSQTPPVYQQTGSEAAIQHNLPQQLMVQQQLPRTQSIQQQQVVQQIQQEPIAPQQNQQQLKDQQQHVTKRLLPQQQHFQQEQLCQQQQHYQQEPFPQQVRQEQLSQQQQFQQEQLSPQQQIQQEQLSQQHVVQCQEQVQQGQLPQQQQAQQGRLTEQQEAEQAACMLQSVYQLEPAVTSSTSVTYTSPPSTTLTSAAPSQQPGMTTPTSMLQSSRNQPAIAVAAPSTDVKNNGQEFTPRQPESAAVLPTSTLSSPSGSQPPADSKDQLEDSSSQMSRSVSRCLYADKKSHTSKASVGKVAGVTSLAGSPFYSNSETPNLGAHEVVGSDNSAAVTPTPTNSAARPPHVIETPVSSKMKSTEPVPVPISLTNKFQTAELCRSPGSARTRLTWPRIQSRSVAKVKETASEPVVESETQLESPTKENKTPEKVLPQGGGTPLATKEAEVAATMVAMATTPVKDKAVPLYSYVSAENPQTVVTSNEQLDHVKTAAQVQQSAAVSQAPGAPGTDRVYKTPKKQRLCTPNSASPKRSPLLKSLIQASAGALLNGHNGTGNSTTRGSPVKRQLYSEKGKDVKRSKSKRQKMAKMDVEKFLEKVHSPNPQGHVP